jgi:hypothetical protein
MKQIKHLLLLIIISFNGLNASGLGGFAGPAWRLPIDAKSAGLGGINQFSQTSDMALFHNPASMVFVPSREFSGGGTELSLDRYIYFLSGSVKLPPKAKVGFATIFSGTRDITAYDSRGFESGTLMDSEQAYLASFALEVTPQLGVGLSLRGNVHHLAAKDGWLDLSASGTGFNFGLIYHDEHLGEIALSFQNLGSAYDWNTTGYFERPSIYREEFPILISFAYHKTVFKALDIFAQQDYYAIGIHETHVGILLNWQEKASLGTGFHYTEEALMPSLFLSYVFPFGENIKMAVNVGVMAGIENEGLRNYLNWRFIF